MITSPISLAISRLAIIIEPDWIGTRSTLNGDAGEDVAENAIGIFGLASVGVDEIALADAALFAFNKSGMAITAPGMSKIYQYKKKR